MSVRDLKIIDASTVLAGPSVGTFFAELGAKVIKVEGPKGDVTQSWRLPSEDQNGWSAYYSSVNYGKENLVLDLLNPEDNQTFQKLVQEADVLITNFKESDHKRFSLTQEALSSVNNKLIWGQIRGFESDSDRLAYDVVLQAESGFMFMNGQPNSLSTKMPVALIDVLAAHQLKEGILLALLERSQNHKGGVVKVSLEAAALSALANQASNFLMTGHVPKKLGSKHPNIAPYGDVFTTSDQAEIVLAVGSNAQFESLCNILNLTSYHSSDFHSNSNRVKNRVRLEEILQTEISKHDSEVLLQKFKELKVPAGKIKNLREVFQDLTVQSLILTQSVEGQKTQRIKQQVFTYSSWSTHK